MCCVRGSTCPIYPSHPISKICICRYPHPSSPVGRTRAWPNLIIEGCLPLRWVRQKRTFVPLVVWVWLRGDGRPEDGLAGGCWRETARREDPWATFPWGHGRLAAPAMSWPGKGQNIRRRHGATDRRGSGSDREQADNFPVRWRPELAARTYVRSSWLDTICDPISNQK